MLSLMGSRVVKRAYRYRHPTPEQARQLAKTFGCVRYVDDRGRAEKRDRVESARARRVSSREQKGSANRAEAELRVARIHGRIADRPRDGVHTLTTRLAREHDTIVIEDLSVRNMVGNRCPARAIHDASWSRLRRRPEDEAAWCSACGTVVAKPALNTRSWTCRYGAVHDRDVNAANAVVAAGPAVSACGDGVRPPRS